MAPTSVRTSVMSFERQREPLDNSHPGMVARACVPRPAPSPESSSKGPSMQIGVYTFVENTPDPATGQTLPATQRLRDLMEEVELADQVGLEVFGIGEHHRPDFLRSAPTIMLAAAAERTQTIRLSTAVTVLSSDDPVRVYEQFSTLDLLSGGRAEIMAGRGSFIE